MAMSTSASTWLLRVAVTVVVVIAACRASEPAFAWLYLAPVLGLCWAGPLVHGLAWAAVQAGQRSRDRPDQRWQSFHGRELALHADATGALWLGLDELHRLGVAVPDGPRLQAWLSATALRQHQGQQQLRADALCDALRHSSQADTLRFVRWLERVLREEALHQQRASGRPGAI
jgi:hypothetical protein